MIVPQFWAEAKATEKLNGRSPTFRRFGWSDDSQELADVHAKRRLAEAIAQARDGEKLPKREPKVPYLGAEGTPIREEIISRHGDTIITRNSYGALCLNTPTVMFVDIDLPEERTRNGSRRWAIALIFVGLLALTAAFLRLPPFGAPHQLMFHIPAVIVLLCPLLAAFGLVKVIESLWPAVPWNEQASGRATRLEQHAVAIQRNIDEFLRARADWLMRIYRTPAGFRLLVMHRTFDPTSSEVADVFSALAADQSYAILCKRQACFRARISPKPWRIGLKGHIKPRPGVWPVEPRYLPARSKWVESYEAAAKDYASCQFVATVGVGPSDPAANAVRELHDAHCHALSDRPIA